MKLNLHKTFSKIFLRFDLDFFIRFSKEFFHLYIYFLKLIVFENFYQIVFKYLPLQTKKMMKTISGSNTSNNLISLPQFVFD